jgi:SMODS-associating 4TM effector domain
LNPQNQDEYIPPTGREIADRQNSLDALRLLLAQRRLYSQSKRWLGLRWLGMVVIAIVAPVVSVIWPNLAVAAGAVAGAWIFIGRTALSRLEQKKVEQAAAVQEVFDQLIFGMPSSGGRAALPSLEEISLLAGPDADIPGKANKQKLTDWYPIDTSQEGLLAVAICQRANASYSDRLLKTTAQVWVIGMAVWAVALVAAGISFKLTAAQFILGILMPLLPPFLDVWEYWRSLRRAAVDRRDLVTTLEQRIAGDAGGLDPQDALVWQGRLFDLRRNAPQVPNSIYWLSRKRNELAMKSAADQLAKKAKGE